MKPARWLALLAGAGLGLGLSCFDPPDFGGPYLCSQERTCALDGYSCVLGVCCKHDGGTPACSGPGPDAGEDAGADGGADAGDAGSDAGSDAGDDAGTDAGSDGGCVVTPCVVSGKVGPCRVGETTCPSGACVQTVFPQPDTCNLADDDCDGVADDYPCQGGPHDVLVPNPDWVTGAAIANQKVSLSWATCVLDDPTFGAQPEYLDGGNWRGRGVNTHLFYVQKDGGYWDLTPAGEGVKFTFSGVVLGGVPPPSQFPNYFQPIVYACGPGGAYRYNPFGKSAVSLDGGSFFVNTTINLASGGGAWGLPMATGLTNLSQINRIEVLLTLNDPFDGGVPGLDAGITAFGFFPP